MLLQRTLVVVYPGEGLAIVGRALAEASSVARSYGRAVGVGRLIERVGGGWIDIPGGVSLVSVRIGGDLASLDLGPDAGLLYDGVIDSDGKIFIGAASCIACELGMLEQACVAVPKGRLGVQVWEHGGREHCGSDSAGREWMVGVAGLIVSALGCVGCVAADIWVLRACALAAALSGLWLMRVANNSALWRYRFMAPNEAITVWIGESPQ